MTARRLVALLATGLLITIFAAPVAAVTYATVDGYLPNTPENNDPATFGEDCTKIEPGGSAYVLDADYVKVIVKAGTGEFANTVFDDPTAGETVWADTNGNGIFDPGGRTGDRDISHMILCPPEEQPTQ